MICQYRSELPGMRGYPNRHQDVAMRASAVRLPGARRLLQNLAIAGLAIAALAVTAANAASNIVQYVYDAAGNIVSIQRANPAPISISVVCRVTLNR